MKLTRSLVPQISGNSESRSLRAGSKHAKTFPFTTFLEDNFEQGQLEMYYKSFQKIIHTNCKIASILL